MASNNNEIIFSKPITSLADVHEVLKTLGSPNINELDKAAFMTLLSGLQVIVDNLEKNKNEVDLEHVIQWIRLYMKVHSLISNCQTRRNCFSKSVPIAITYIIGCLQHAPTQNLNFYTEIITMATELIRNTDREALRALETIGKRVIKLLWDVIDRVGNFKTQFQILEFYILILKDLDVNFKYWEIKSIPNIKSEEICYKIMELLRTPNDNDLFKMSARSILNQYNSERTCAKVQSFYCKSLEIGSDMKFLKPTNSKRFWFDINENGKTLSFEGRVTKKRSRKYQNVEVSLKIADMFMENNSIKIKFTPPVMIVGAVLQDVDVYEVDIACIALCKTEDARFMKIFNVSKKTSHLLSTKTKVCAPSTHRHCNNSNLLRSDVLIDNPINVVESSTHFSVAALESQKQIQQVKPFSSTFPTNTAANAARPSTTFDEYENIEVSDAEPCQSYKNFITRKFESSNRVTSTPKFKQLKRKHNNEDKSKDNGKPEKIHKEFNVFDYGPSTSKNCPKIQEYEKSSLTETAFDDLKKDASSSNATLYFGLTKDMTSAQRTTEFGRTKEHLSPKISGGKEIDLSTPKSISNISTGLITHSKNKDDCLVYHKRSDNDSSSDSGVPNHTTPKRKISKLERTSLKKMLLDQSHVDDSDSNCYVTEYIFLASTNHSNTRRLRNVLSSFFEDNRSVFKCSRTNIQVTNTNDVVEFNTDT